MATVKLLVPMVGERSWSVGDEFECSVAEARRLIKGGMAARMPKQQTGDTPADEGARDGEDDGAAEVSADTSTADATAGDGAGDGEVDGAAEASADTSNADATAG